MNKEIVQAVYTSEEIKYKKEIDDIDNRIKVISEDYKKEQNKKSPNKETIKKLNNETGYLIRHRNILVEKLYGDKNGNDKANNKTDK